VGTAWGGGRLWWGRVGIVILGTGLLVVRKRRLGAFGRERGSCVVGGREVGASLQGGGDCVSIGGAFRSATK